jgi:hypothetical protein
MNKKRVIPFSWTPASWGLSGKSRQRAEAEYYLEGYDLDKRMIEIDHDKEDHPLEFLKLDHKYEKIADYDFAMKYAEMTLEGDELAIRKLELDFTAEKLTENEFNKQVATIKKEPYIKVLSEYHPQNGQSGLELEFDWNEFWIKELVANGYVGYNEDQIVQMWFEDLCRSVVTENMEAQDVPFNSGRTINRRNRGGTHSDFS